MGFEGGGGRVLGGAGGQGILFELEICGAGGGGGFRGGALGV